MTTIADIYGPEVAAKFALAAPGQFAPGQALSPEWMRYLDQMRQSALQRGDGGMGNFQPDSGRLYSFDKASGNIIQFLPDGSYVITPNAQALGDNATREQVNGLPSYTYDARGNLASQGVTNGYLKDDGGYRDLMAIGAIAAAPFAVAGLQGLAAGAGAVGSAGGAAGAAGAAPSITGLAGSGMVPAGMGFSTGAGALGAGATSFGTGALGLDAALGSFGAAAGIGGAAGGLAGAAGTGGAGTTAGAAGVSSSVIPEGAAFTPATAAEMGAMGLGGAGMSMPSWLGPAASVVGGLLGSQGTQQNATTTRDLPAYLQAPVSDLVGRTQGLLGDQMAPAYAAGSQMVSQGQGLLSSPVAGNGYGQVKLNAPTTSTNPYLSGLAEDIQRRTGEMLGQNNLAIQGNAVAAGGLGGSRQGVAQGVAAGKAADYLSGNLAGLYGTAYNNDQNRALQQYGMDQNFWTGQRGQDLAQVGVGAGLLDQGFQTQFAPLRNAASVYSPFSGFGTSTTSQQQGGGASGALGGFLGAAQFGNNMGWWG